MQHGALSTPEGEIDISWTINETEDPKIVDLTWRELKGPDVSPPTEFGFGAKLVERSLKRGLGAKVDVAWEKPGLIVHMELPVPELRREDYFSP
jgi:two-component sensor histidine kinase